MIVRSFPLLVRFTILILIHFDQLYCIGAALRRSSLESGDTISYRLEDVKYCVRYFHVQSSNLKSRSAMKSQDFSMLDTRVNCLHEEIEAGCWPSITEILIVDVQYFRERPPYVFTRMLEHKLSIVGFIAVS